ncbi:MAG: LysR family transcriptional regulator [Albidovulum sp.]|uniref:LysR substrate-binding domain-containing protein n=1 Tax=Albidovulum sp. TaxID=1872424 RepID=UPI00132516C2|nr:LysR substrate-binding domain-containing protein [Defluviimonas sp.]KAB2883850.1 MAG: LysR family transcriptional regulator [Defluviimonas sp.]
MSRIPSTQALRALESFARHGTVWQAADELHLTRSAVSHQLRLLERDLGFRLMNRVGTRAELTPQGKAYAEDVRRALSVIAGSASRQAGRGVTGTLTVSCPPGFASSWLCPKVGRFRETCPDVVLSLVTPRRLDDVSNPDVDLFIAFGLGNQPDMEVELLKRVEFTPLCSPALLNRLDGLPDLAGVLQANLLHLTDFEDWITWFRLAGLPEEAARTGQRFSDMNLVYAATLASQGMSMGDEFICHEAMAQGILVRPFDLAIRSPRSYYLVVPPEKAANPAVAAFRSWMADELPMA